METKVMDAQAVETARKESRKYVIWTSDDFTNEEAMREWWECNLDGLGAYAVALELGIDERKLTEEQAKALEILAPVFEQAKREKGPDEGAWEVWQEMICDYLDDQKHNLDKDVRGTIIALTERSIGYGKTEIDAEIIGHNVNEILSCEDGEDYDVAEWFGQDGEICRDLHYCYTRHTIYRIADYDDADEICDEVNADRLTMKDAMKMTDSLYPAVARVYGWD